MSAQTRGMIAAPRDASSRCDAKLLALVGAFWH
jgi:hypothetical protein